MGYRLRAGFGQLNVEEMDRSGLMDGGGQNRREMMDEDQSGDSSVRCAANMKRALQDVTCAPCAVE